MIRPTGAREKKVFKILSYELAYKKLGAHQRTAKQLGITRQRVSQVFQKYKPQLLTHIKKKDPKYFICCVCNSEVPNSSRAKRRYCCIDCEEFNLYKCSRCKAVFVAQRNHQTYCLRCHTIICNEFVKKVRLEGGEPYEKLKKIARANMRRWKERKAVNENP